MRRVRIAETINVDPVVIDAHPVARHQRHFSQRVKQGWELVWVRMGAALLAAIIGKVDLL